MSHESDPTPTSSASISSRSTWPNGNGASCCACFLKVRTEGGKIDFDRLKLTLGAAVDIGKERYGLTWPGKAECFRTIQTPSTATLRPTREESVNFDTTENLIIEGDNLEVLKLLQKAYLGRVKMIYIDPPYNTGQPLHLPDNYTESLQTYLQYTGRVDAEGTRGRRRHAIRRGIRHAHSPNREVAELLGLSVATLLEHYSHIRIDAKRQALDALDAARRQAAPNGNGEGDGSKGNEEAPNEGGIDALVEVSGELTSQSRHSLRLSGSPPSGRLLIPLERRDVRVVEGARLEIHLAVRDGVLSIAITVTDSDA